MVEKKIFNSREEWLNGRKSLIGGSDAACILGLNPYKTNVELWEEKALGKPAEDISEKPYVKYGTEAEKYLRELFKLDFPEFEVFYEENNMFLNPAYPWAHYSADGWLIEKETGKKGIWECKTTNILQSMQKEKWKDRIPDNYYIQLLHGFMILEDAEFAILKAQLKAEFKGEIYLQTKHYRIEREDVAEDIEYLIKRERVFAEQIRAKTRPGLILPEI